MAESIPVFDVGDSVRYSVTFTAAGTPTNPTSTTLTLTRPDGTTVTPSPTNMGPGLYQADYQLDQAGLWKWEWRGTGAVVATDKGNVRAR
jgi:hypothetical protein